MITVYSQNVWNCPPASYRNTLIRSLVSDVNPDICMFQECGPFTVRAAKIALPDLMKDVYVEACAHLADRNFTPIYYKRNKYDLVDSGYFLFDGLNDSNSKSVTWIVLEEKGTSVKCAFVSTHFWWKFDSEKDNQQRLENVDQLYEICNFIIEKYNVPVIIGGDLNNGKNSDQGEEPYEYMKQKGFNDIRLSAEETTDEYTHHDYPILNENEIYENGPMPVRNLDYIFTYGDYNINVKKFDIITSQNALNSSDHCPLIGKLEII